ncbi:MAG: hypothetical protein R3E88_21735 [Myxococcota bacterium]
MTDLATLANLAEILGGATVVGGAFFAVRQLREARRVREDAVASELMRSFYSPELARAVQVVMALPDETDADSLRALGPEHESAALLVATTFETMGLLVFRRIAPFSLVRDLAGGLSRVMWRKLARWVEETRVRNRQPTFSEWFQWLVERLDDWDGAHTPVPAHVRGAGWKPRAD